MNPLRWNQTTQKKNRSSSSSSRSRDHNGGHRPTAVGTEQWAQQEYQKNRTLYSYPSNGFVHKIESTLLYNMISYPNIYPIHVIHPMILLEDYTPYIYINESCSSNRSSSTSHNSSNRSTTEEDTTTTATLTSSSSSPPPCSYAQLTALLALAAEKWPPTTTTSSSSSSSSSAASSQHHTTGSTTPQRRTSDYDDSDENENDDDDEYEQSRQRRQQQQRQNEEAKEQLNVVPTLCQSLIQCIIRHCDKYELHRETEINELFLPFHTVTSHQTTKRAIWSTVPAYMGLTVTILSGGNPIPFYIGYAMSINAISQQEAHLQNYHHIANTTTRMSHMETTNLLHDTDHNNYNDNDD